MAEMTERDNSRYQERYGAWAGFPQGHKPDFDHCCAKVYNGTTRRFTQCRKKRGHGPGEAYCATHNPDAVTARNDKKRADSNARWEAERVRWYGPTFLEALEKIANGHNDARGLAQEVIAEFKKSER